MNQCTPSLIGYIPDLCAPSHLFSSAQPPIQLPYIQKNGFCCLAVAADLLLTSSTDVLHCCAIPAILTHASVLFAVHTAQFFFASEAVCLLSIQHLQSLCLLPAIEQQMVFVVSFSLTLCLYALQKVHV